MADFSKLVRRYTFARQKGVCALCGIKLNELLEETEMNSMHFHHVQPNSLHGHNDIDNCVVLCSDTYKGAKNSCHYRVHQNGNYKGKVVAGPEYFPFSHGGAKAEHSIWILQWHSKYG